MTDSELLSLTDEHLDPDTLDLASDDHDGHADHVEEASTDDTDPDQSSLAMFEGDTSSLFPEQRLCLHALLKQRYLSADRHPDHWVTLEANENLIRSRLNDLFLELEIDRQQRIAYKRSVTTEAGDPLPSLLRNIAHTKEETIVMVALRQRYFAQRQEGDDIVFVDRETLLEEVAERRPEHATNRAMDHKRANKAIDALASAEILRTTEDPDRFEILGIIEVLLPIEKLRELQSWLMSANSGAGPVDDATEQLDPDDHDDHDDVAYTDALIHLEVEAS